MSTMYRVETQGISRDYRESTGSFDTINRGSMDQEALLELLNRVRYMEDPARIHNTTELCTPLVTVTGDAGRFSFIVDEDGKFFNVEHETIITPIEAVSVAGGLNPSGSSNLSSQSMHQKTTSSSRNAGRSKPVKKMSFLLKLAILIFIILVVYATMSENLETQTVLVFGVLGSILWFFFKKGRRGRRSGSYGTTYHDTRHESDRLDDERDTNDGGSDSGDSDDGGSDD
jgi:hypothetical protein